MSRDLVTGSGVPDVADVQVPGEKQIRLRVREALHRFGGAPEQPLFADTLRQVERMVCHDDAYDVRWRAGKRPDDIVHLPSVDPALTPGERSRGIHANHD